MAPITHTAVQGVCAWPNLQLLPDGNLLATGFNKPCHGLWEGDLDCWASADGGWKWEWRGRAAAHEATTNRMNHAVGQLPGGGLLVACSGWSNRGPAGDPRWYEGLCLRAWVSRSQDGGRNWERIGELPDSELTCPGLVPSQPRCGQCYHNNGVTLIPFGDIQPGADGALRMSVYAGGPGGHTAWVLRSGDGGVTWGEPALVREGCGTETALLHLGEGRWLAACRAEPPAQLELFTSADDARTWVFSQTLSLPQQAPAHLLRLAEGRILLTYGNRCGGHLGVDIRVSADEGKSWSAPRRLAESPQGDSGYPATVQLPEGGLVTAFYTRIAGEFQYELRVTRWEAEDLP